jgi:hypothetical protein
MGTHIKDPCPSNICSIDNQQDSKDIDVGVPSLHLLKNIHSQIPNKLSDSALIRYYAYLKAARLSFIQCVLPKEYYEGIADAGGVTGRVPKDVFALTNIDYTLDEFQKEVSKRKLMDKYSLMIDPFHSDVERQKME